MAPDDDDEDTEEEVAVVLPPPRLVDGAAVARDRPVALDAVPSPEPVVPAALRRVGREAACERPRVGAGGLAECGCSARAVTGMARRRGDRLYRCGERASRWRHA